MTNAEKFKEIFGIEPDCGRCNPYPCEENDCKYWAECENQPGCPCDGWWEWEYKKPEEQKDFAERIRVIMNEWSGSRHPELTKVEYFDKIVELMNKV